MLKPAGLIAFYLCIFLSAVAETITGNCTVLDRPLGDNQFQLVPGTVVQCSAPQKGWCMILYKAWIDKKYVYEGIRIQPNARLRNAKGKTTGKALASMNPYRTIEENDTCFVMEIAGFIEVVCIEDTSVVEHELEKLYLQNATGLSRADFATHFQEFNYVPWLTADSMQAFLLKETDILSSRPGLRVVVIFDGDRAAAILHSRGLQPGKFESVTRTQNYTLVYLHNYAEARKKRIADVFLSRADAMY